MPLPATGLSFDETFSLARDALASGAFAKAAQLFAQCTQLQENHSAAWFLLGASLDQCGQPLQAMQAFARTESLDPAHPQAANACAAMLSLLERHAEALAAFRRALALNPDDAQILTNLGITSEKLGRRDEALNWYDSALKADPDHLGALSNRGTLLLQMARPQQALADHLHFVSRAPSSAIGHFNCAETYGALGLQQEALASCEAALKCDPAHLKAHIMRGFLLAETGHLDEAAAALAVAARLDPEKSSALLEVFNIDPRQNGSTNARNIYCLRGLNRLRVCDWRDYARFVETLESLVHAATKHPSSGSINHVGIPHTALALPLPQPTQLALARLVADNIKTALPRVSQPVRARDDKLRIAYVSPDFRDHATAYLLCDFFHRHDRQKFSVHAYSLYTDEASQARQDIVAGCDSFQDIAGLPTNDIVEIIRNDEIDILIDLAGYTEHARPEIFAARPAPINIAYLGYPGTSGSEAIDYFIANRITIPSGQEAFFSEKMIYLPGNCYPYPQMRSAAAPQYRQAHHLPDNAFVFCGFNNPFKLEPELFSAWMRILQRVPQGVLWLYCPQAAVAENLKREAAARNIDPDRLIFAPPLPLKEHLARFPLADLFLDAFLCNGHTTGLDALWSGLPLLTCPGQSFAARCGTSHLTALGMPELIAASPAEYEERAVHLATHQEELQAIRRKLAVQRLQAPLFQMDQLVQQLEAAYQQAWKRHQAGQPPEHIEISHQTNHQ